MEALGIAFTVLGAAFSALETALGVARESRYVKLQVEYLAGWIEVIYIRFSSIARMASRYEIPDEQSAELNVILKNLSRHVDDMSVCLDNAALHSQSTCACVYAKSDRAEIDQRHGHLMWDMAELDKQPIVQTVLRQDLKLRPPMTSDVVARASGMNYDERRLVDIVTRGESKEAGTALFVLAVRTEEGATRTLQTSRSRRGSCPLRALQCKAIAQRRSCSSTGALRSTTCATATSAQSRWPMRTLQLRMQSRPRLSTSRTTFSLSTSPAPLLPSARETVYGLGSAARRRSISCTATPS
jgi:hypothetical protein